MGFILASLLLSKSHLLCRFCQLRESIRPPGNLIGFSVFLDVLCLARCQPGAKQDDQFTVSVLFHMVTQLVRVRHVAPLGMLRMPSGDFRNASLAMCSPSKWVKPSVILGFAIDQHTETETASWCYTCQDDAAPICCMFLVL